MKDLLLSRRDVGLRLLAFLAAVPASIALAPSASAQYGSRDVMISDAVDSTLNLRVGPGLNYRIIGRMPNGSWATILQVRGNWAQVRHESGRVGWAWYHYMVRFVGQELAVRAAAPRGAIALRSGPGTQHRHLRSLNNGTRMLAGEQRGNWLFLYRMDGRPLGWGPRNHLVRG